MDKADRQAYARRYANNDEQYDLLMGAETIVLHVSERGENGHRTVRVLDEWDGVREYQTDSAGDLQVGAGRWIKLGNVTTRTAMRRVAMHYANPYAR